MYACSLGDVRVLFLEKGESRHATALRGARSRFEGPIGSFSMYVCVNVMLGHCFDGNHRPGLTPACGLRRAKSRFWNRWGLFLCTFVV